MKTLSFFTKVTALAIITSLFGYCSNENGNPEEKENPLNEQETITGADKRPYLKIDGEIDAIYSFLPYENPFTGTQLSPEEAMRNAGIKREAFARIPDAVVVDFQNKEMIIAEDAKSLNMDENLFKYLMDTPSGVTE